MAYGPLPSVYEDPAGAGAQLSPFELVVGAHVEKLGVVVDDVGLPRLLRLIAITGQADELLGNGLVPDSLR